MTKYILIAVVILLVILGLGIWLNNQVNQTLIDKGVPMTAIEATTTPTDTLTPDDQNQMDSKQ